MSELYRLSGMQMAKPEPFFPKSHGKPRVDDTRLLSGIIFETLDDARRKLACG